MGRRSAALAVLGAMWLGGCDSTGPTGSSAAVPPVDAAAGPSEDAGTLDAAAPPDTDSGAPFYSSAVGFMPSPPGAGGSSGVSRSTNNPANNPGAADVAKVHGDYLIVATQPVPLPDGYGAEAIQTRGLLIFALGPSGLPELAGELGLDGTPVALEVSDGTITLVVRGRSAYESDSLPNDPMPFSMTRMLRIDWSDRAAPRLVASADLDGEFWHVEVAGDRSIVLSSLPLESASVCGGGEGRGPQRMQVTTYALSADGYQRLEDQTLVGDGYTAFFGPGYLIGVADASMSPPQTLQALRISPTEVTFAPPLEVPGVITAASMDGPLLAVAYDTSVNSAAELALYDVAPAGGPQLVGKAPVPPQTSSISPLGVAVGWLLGSTGDGTVVVDTSDPLAPVVTPLPEVFPAGRLGSVVIGVGFEPAARTARFSTWDVTEPRAPALLGTVASDWPYSPPYWSVDETNRRLLYPFSRTSNGVSQAGFGRVDIDPAGIPVLTAPVPVETVASPLGHAQAAYLASFGSLETVPFDGSGTTEVYQYYAEDPRRVLDEITTPEYAARLVRRGARVTVELEGAAGTVTIELTHRADQLLLVGSRLVALAFSNGVVCPSYDLTSSPLCSATDQAGISVISLGPDPQLELGMLLSDAPGAPSLPSDASAYSSWFGYLALDGGRILLPMTQVLGCRTSAACDALGITPPDPDAGTAVVQESQQWLYVLDVAGVEPALLPLRVETMYDESYPRGGNLEISVQRSGAIVAFPRTEVDYAPVGGQPVGPVHYWLERLRVSDTGALTPLPSLSIPGQALALRDDATTLITLDATAESDGGAVEAHVSRSSIRDDGAYVEESLTLGPGLRDAIALGDRIFAIMGPPAWCEPAPTSQVFAVSSTAGMSQLPALTLPGDRWRFARAEAPWPPNTLLLVDGLGWGWARIELDVADATVAPRVIRYYSDGL